MKFVLAWVLSGLFLLGMYNYYSESKDKFNQACAAHQGHVESSLGVSFSCLDAENKVIFST